MSPLLSVEHLALQLAQHDQPLLRDVSFTLAAGESLGLVGESGSGKSLTTRAIMRLLAPTTSVRGEIRYDGTDVVAMSRRELRNWRSSDVGMIFQDPRAHINPVREPSATFCWRAGGAASRTAWRPSAAPCAYSRTSAWATVNVACAVILMSCPAAYCSA